MSDAGNTDYIPDHLYARLFQPWTLPAAEWPLAQEDWTRVRRIVDLPWKGQVLDVGSGDGTLGAMVCSHNPAVTALHAYEPDAAQVARARERWAGWPITAIEALDTQADASYDGALCCEVLEHLHEAEGIALLKTIRRLLKPGALFCATVPLNIGPRALYPGHVRQFSWLDFANAIYAGGFVAFPWQYTTIQHDSVSIWLLMVCDV
jgi:2-polyprenyl-3-methyl-5-hydroxy-6-metoxy-1,4-benzoquinol methylase